MIINFNANLGDLLIIKGLFFLLAPLDLRLILDRFLFLLLFLLKAPNILLIVTLHNIKNEVFDHLLTLLRLRLNQ
jgi:hypothetical protein